MKHKHHFGAALLKVREARGLPQDALGQTQSHISRLEHGTKAPSWERVEALAEVVGLHPATVFVLSYFDGSKDQQRELLKRIQAELNALLGHRR